MIYNIAGFHGGLGDCLQFSTLPELLVKQGHTVNLYTGPEVLPFRNPDIKELWLRNPYISGEVKDNWNMGDIPGKPYKNTTGSFIKNWEAVHGLPPTNDLPILYHTFSPLHRIVVNYGLIELSSKTLSYNPQAVINAVKQLVLSYDFEFYIMVSDYQHQTIPMPELQTIKVNGIIHAAELINGSKVFISLNSGLHSLGAAVKRNNVNKKYHTHYHCLLPENDYDWIMSDKKFIFEGINYIKA